MHSCREKLLELHVEIKVNYSNYLELELFPKMASKKKFHHNRTLNKNTRLCMKTSTTKTSNCIQTSLALYKRLGNFFGFTSTRPQRNFMKIRVDELGETGRVKAERGNDEARG